MVLSWCKKQTQSFSLLLWNYLLILKILPVSHFKDLKAANLTLKMHTGSRLWFSIIIPEAACDKLTLAHFPRSLWEVGIREHWPITEKEILRRVSNLESIFKISQQFQRKKQKGNNCVKSFWKTLKTISTYIERTS